jgi:glutamate synthase domain-containing protein 3
MWDDLSPVAEGVRGNVTHGSERTACAAESLNLAESGTICVDARGVPYRELNVQLKKLIDQGARSLVLKGIMGQRYIGTNLQQQVRLVIEGVPGNDLGAFMDGPAIEVLGDAQDGCGNTMNSGSIVIHGSAGDILGHSMRGGKILVRDNVGYRVGIHMKEYGAVRPVIVIGGTAQHFLGEYMAGGVLIVLGLNLKPGEYHPSHFVGTGMHGGVIYLRGQVDTVHLGKEVGQVALTPDDEWLLRKHIQEYTAHFGGDAEEIQGPFVKLAPLTKRPYGRLYAY